MRDALLRNGSSLMVFAAVGAVATVAGSVISSSASSKATKASSKAAAANNQLATDQYNLNSANLKPYSDRGNIAGGYVSDLLGVGGDPAKSAAAFQNYQNSTGYQYQLQQGLGAVNSNAYARGMGDSGATLKALQDRGNNIAASSFNNYLGQLTNVQNTGMAAGSALAGTGQTMVSNVSANNNNAAATAGNAALSNASNINGSIQNLIGAGAYAYGSSYGGGKAPGFGASGAGGTWV